MNKYRIEVARDQVHIAGFYKKEPFISLYFVNKLT